MKNKNLSFLWLGLVALSVFGSVFWIQTQEKSGRIPWVLRESHELSGRLWQWFYRENAAPPKTYAKKGTPVRINGLLGLDKRIDINSWQMKVFEESQEVATIGFEQILSFPKTQTSTEFYCIEGWSTYFSYTGVRFADFLTKLNLGSHYRFVNIQTPDGKYYVSIDMLSMLHPQTLLAYEMNEALLTQENGAPLRLVIPIKYGIKSIKRIGKIQLSNTKGPDYWAERGYDWYSGL